jgi:hypothetical protein
LSEAACNWEYGSAQESELRSFLAGACNSAGAARPAARSPSCSCRPRAAEGRPLAGLEFVEKLLTTNLSGTDTTARIAGMLRVPLVASLSRPGYWLELFVVLVVAAVYGKLSPSF